MLASTIKKTKRINNIMYQPTWHCIVKTNDIKKIRESNDKKYLRKLEIEAQATRNSKVHMEARLKASQEAKDKRYQMFLIKRKEAEDYKREIASHKTELINLRREREQQNFERKLLIRQQHEQGKKKHMQFLAEKR